MRKSKRIACIEKDCVACGVCVTVCPRSALKIDKGVRAKVDNENCVGCGICAKICPAAVISIIEREGVV